MITENTVWTAKCDITGVKTNSIALGSKIGKPITDLTLFKKELEKEGWRITMGTEGEKLLCPAFIKSLVQ